MIFQVSDAYVDRWLDEDIPYGDLTTHLLGIGGVPARMTFRTRAETVIGGLREASRILERVGCVVERHVEAAALLAAGEIILEAHGEAVAPNMVIAATRGHQRTERRGLRTRRIAILVTSAIYAAVPADVGVMIEPC